MQSLSVTSQSDLIQSVLDRIIPSTENLPGAGELGVIDYLDAVTDKSDDLKRIFLRGLAYITMNDQASVTGRFISLSDEQKDTLLRWVESQDPEFFQALVRHTYNGYYTNPKIIALLGLEVRPPQPAGFLLETGDLSSLDTVRRRGSVYRNV